MSTQFDPLSEKIDLVWSSGYDRPNVFSNYYDYYFSGEDIKVYIDGLFGQEDELDIASFAYSVRQEKQPLYGFWSYNYDAVMLGTRIITGEITLFTRYPQRMTDLLKKAANSRMKNPENRSLNETIVSRMYPSNFNDEDDINLQKYWSMSQLDRITSDPNTADIDKNNIFSAHPPFNFVVLYGSEETAISPTGLLRSQDFTPADNLDRMITSDVNERSVRTDDTVAPMKIILQQVNLMNMSTAYTPGGQPVAESYQFIARDYYFTEQSLSFVKKIQTNDLQGIDTSTTEPPSTATNASTSGGGGPSARVM